VSAFPRTVRHVERVGQPYSKTAGTAFWVLYVYFSSGAWLPVIRPHQDLGEAAGYVGPTWLVLLVAVVALSATKRGAIIRSLQVHPWVWAIALLAAASTAWSIAPSESASRALALTQLLLASAYIAGTRGLSGSLRLVMWGLGIAGLTSLVLVSMWPAVGVDAGIHTGAWQGVFHHKNHLGRFMAVLCTLSAALGAKTRTEARTQSVFWIVGAAMVVGSRSATGLILTLLGTGLALGLRAIQTRRGEGLATVALTVLPIGGLLVWLSAGNDGLAGTFTRDASLTGRTDLWAMALEASWRLPFTGYGYGNVFWSVENPVAWPFFSRLRWVPPDAHNGLLDLVIGLGLPGLVLGVASVVVVGVRYSRQFAQGQAPASAEALPILVVLVFLNLTESVLFRAPSTFMMLFAVIAFSIAERRRDRGRRSGGSGESTLSDRRTDRG
jgi:exopolysaccharide production protein ExoQ